MIVLDTHAWLWWLSDPGRLSRPAADAIAQAQRIGVSTLSCWEVVMLVDRGRIALDRPVSHWVRAALRADDRVQALAPDADVAVRAGLLAGEGFHGDPADRFIYATALAAGAKLVTRDRALRGFDGARTVW